MCATTLQFYTVIQQHSYFFSLFCKLLKMLISYQKLNNAITQRNQLNTRPVKANKEAYLYLFIFFSRKECIVWVIGQMKLLQLSESSWMEKEGAFRGSRDWFTCITTLQAVRNLFHRAELLRDTQLQGISDPERVQKPGMHQPPLKDTTGEGGLHSFQTLNTRSQRHTLILSTQIPSLSHYQFCNYSE